MPTLTYPGVYVEEVSGGVRPLQIAGTSTAAFVGLAQMGPDDAVLQVTSWTEFQRYYGTFISDGYPGPQRVPVLQQRRPAVLHRPGDAQRRRGGHRHRPEPGAYARRRPDDQRSQQGGLGQLPLPADRGRHARPGKRVPHQRPAAGRSRRDPAELPEHHAPRGLRQPEPGSRRAQLRGDRAPGSVQPDRSRQLRPPIPASSAACTAAGSARPSRCTTTSASQINLDGDGPQIVTLPSAAGTAVLADVASAIQTAVQALTKLKTSTRRDGVHRLHLRGQTVERAVRAWS